MTLDEQFHHFPFNLFTSIFRSSLFSCDLVEKDFIPSTQPATHPTTPTIVLKDVPFFYVKCVLSFLSNGILTGLGSPYNISAARLGGN